MGDKILIAYASRAGSTGEIAEAVGQVLCKAGAIVDVRRIQDVKDIKPYRSVIIGSAVRMGRLLPETVRFAKKHNSSLQQIPTAYFVTGITMRKDTPENRKQAVSYLEPLCRIKEPVSMGLFGGKVDHSKLGLLWRFFLSFDKEGMPREGDWRNWEAIFTWAVELCTALSEK